MCLHNPDIFIIPTLLGGGVPEVGSEPKEQTALEEAKGGDAGFPVEHKGKEEPWHHGVGHLVLVVAERIGTDIHLKISNSLDGYPADRVTRIAGNVIRFSGWMDVREPRIVRVWQQCVSQQSLGSNTCGTHVILNGWAYLLRIKVNQHWRPSEELYEEDKNPINSALCGDITGGHIEAWMFAKEFAEPRSLEDRVAYAADAEMAQILKASSTLINNQLYTEYLEQARLDEVAAAPPD